ncbi:MAG TPA: alpha/beta hydrolase [Gemmatimonadaceae bacterium]
MATQSQLEGYDYRHEAGSDASAPVLLLLHGTGGDENDLIPFARLVSPGSAVVSPRGNVSENGAARYFRRIREGVFDLEDLALRTAALLKFLKAAAKAHTFSTDHVVALGFSNGANVAASMMLTEPSTLRHGILIRAMQPFQPATLPDMKKSSALIAAGRSDQMISQPMTEKLAELMRSAGARVELKWQDAGHGMIQADVNDAREYLRAWKAST